MAKSQSHFKDQFVSINSFIFPLTILNYTSPIATKNFNYKHEMLNLATDELKAKLFYCSCVNSLFKYGPAVLVITGDFNVVKSNLSKPSFLRNQNIMSRFPSIGPTI